MSDSTIAPDTATPSTPTTSPPALRHGPLATTLRALVTLVLLAGSACAVYVSYQYVNQPTDVLQPLKTHKGGEGVFIPKQPRPKRGQAPKSAPKPAETPQESEAPPKG
jgi:hypothetical protein